MRRRLSIVLLALVPVFCIGVIMWSQTRPLLPGLGGCRTIRDRVSRIECIERGIRAEIDDRGVTKGLLSVGSTTHTWGGQVTEDCHRAMHAVGRKLLRDDPHFKRLYMAGERRRASITACGDGFRHGLSQEVFENRNIEIGGFLDMCHSITMRASAVECYHSLGHGLGGRGGAAQARDTCDRLLEESPNSRDNCMGGYFMEKMGRHPAPADDPAKACEGADPADVYACFTQVPDPVNFRGKTMSTAERISLCRRVAKRSDVALTACSTKVGLWADTVDGKISVCHELGGPVPEQACAALFASAASSRDTSGDGDGNLDRVHGICERAGTLSFGCWSGLGTWLRNHERPESDCSNGIASGAADACRTGYRLCWPASPGHTLPDGCTALRSTWSRYELT